MRHTEELRGEGHMKSEAEIEMIEPLAKELLEAPAARKGKE